MSPALVAESETPPATAPAESSTAAAPATASASVSPTTIDHGTLLLPVNSDAIESFTFVPLASQQRSNHSPSPRVFTPRFFVRRVNSAKLLHPERCRHLRCSNRRDGRQSAHGPKVKASSATTTATSTNAICALLTWLIHTRSHRILGYRSPSNAQSSPRSPDRRQPESSPPHKSPASVVSFLQVTASPPIAAFLGTHVGLRQPRSWPNSQPASPCTSRGCPCRLRLNSRCPALAKPHSRTDSSVFISACIPRSALSHPSRVNRRAIFCCNTSNSLQPNCTWPTFTGTSSVAGERLSNTCPSFIASRSLTRSDSAPHPPAASLATATASPTTGALQSASSTAVGATAQNPNPATLASAPARRQLCSCHRPLHFLRISSKSGIALCQRCTRKSVKNTSVTFKSALCSAKADFSAAFKCSFPSAASRPSAVCRPSTVNTVSRTAAQLHPHPCRLVFSSFALGSFPSATSATRSVKATRR